jgi:hypothetical protein
MNNQPSTELVQSSNNQPLLIFEFFKSLLATAKSIAEVKDIRDKALGLATYARQANDRQREADAEAIRLEAERRLGQMMQAQKNTVGLNEGGRPPKTGFSDNPVLPKPTLASQGIDKNLAHRAREHAAMPEDAFNKKIETTRAGTKITAQESSKASKSPAPGHITTIPVSFRRWMKLAPTIMMTYLSPRDCANWTRKERGTACEIINRIADEIVAKIRAADADTETSYPTTTAQKVRADKRKRAEKAGARRARRLYRSRP